MRPILLDQLSAFPLLQQVIGIGTFLKGLVEFIVAFVKSIFHRLEVRTLTQRLQAAEATNDVTIEMLKGELNIAKKYVDKTNRACTESLKEIGIGILRFTPIVGSVYSGYVWYKYNKNESSLDDSIRI